MKKSKSVPITLVASIAALALAGCGGSTRQVRRCVDAQGRVLPDYECNTTSTRRTGGFYPYWVYGGSLSNGRVSGYSRTPSSSSDIVDSKGSVVRRGFGGGSSSSSSSTSRSSFGG